MTEYTPTVQGVREAAANGFSRSNGYNSVTPDEFDRWLAQHESEVAQAERERIPYLLESVAEAFLEPSEYKDGYLEAARHVLENDWPIQYGGNK
jgi:hypothetical protein